MILKILVLGAMAQNFHFQEIITECSEANISKIQEDNGRNYQHFGVKYYDGTRDTVSMDTDTHYFELFDSRGNLIAGSAFRDMEARPEVIENLENFSVSLKAGTDEPQLSNKLYNYTEADMVNFGEFLLKNRGYAQKNIYHADLENWKHQRANDEPVK